MQLPDEHVCRIVDSTWTCLLGLAVEQVPESNFTGGSSVTGVVQIAGGWEGTVLLVCASDLARKAGAAMLAVEEDQLSADELRDALGELVNTIAGNIKALIPGAMHLSLPTVVEGRDYELTVPGSSVLTRVSFVSEGMNMQVRVLQREHARPS